MTEEQRTQKKTSRLRGFSKSFRLTEDELKQVNRMLNDNRKNGLESESETLLRLLEIGLQFKDKPEDKWPEERWLCPFCQNPFSVENRLRLLSHFKNTHLLEFEENPALMKLRKIFQVAMNTGKIKECEFLDLSKYPAECLKDFPDRTYKIDGMLKCKACQTRQRQALERRTGIPLAPVQQPISDCHFIQGTYFCSKFNKPCDHPNCYHYIKKETGQ